MWVAFAFAKSTHIFSNKNTCELDIVLTGTVNILTTNELVKLTTLCTTGPKNFTLDLSEAVLPLQVIFDTNIVEYYIGRKNVSTGRSGQWRPRSACISTQFDQDLHCPQTDVLNATVSFFNTEQMPGWDCACAEWIWICVVCTCLKTPFCHVTASLSRVFGGGVPRQCFCCCCFFVWPVWLLAFFILFIFFSSCSPFSFHVSLFVILLSSLMLCLDPFAKEGAD